MEYLEIPFAWRVLADQRMSVQLRDLVALVVDAQREVLVMVDIEAFVAILRHAVSKELDRPGERKVYYNFKFVAFSLQRAQ